jgi:hypothetical protein
LLVCGGYRARERVLHLFGREPNLQAEKLTENVCDYMGNLALESGLLWETVTTFFLDFSRGGMENQTPAWIFSGQFSLLK